MCRFMHARNSISAAAAVLPYLASICELEGKTIGDGVSVQPTVLVEFVHRDDYFRRGSIVYIQIVIIAAITIPNAVCFFAFFALAFVFTLPETAAEQCNK